MATSQRRGTAALGGVLVIVGLVGGALLWVLAMREPDRVVDAFARAAPGCRTTLSFSDAGEYYVYAERSSVGTTGGCEPSAVAGQPFEWLLTGPDGAVVPSAADDTVGYDLDAGAGTSVARVTIASRGDYQIEVSGSDPAMVVAIGGDPDANVDRLRMAAIGSAAIGILIGGGLLWWSRRRPNTIAGAGDAQVGVSEWPPRPPSVQLPESERQPWAPPDPRGRVG